MKKMLIATATLIVATFATTAQTTNNPAQGFVTSFANYFTSFNTNYLFNSVRIELSTGYKQVNGANAANELYGQCDISNFDIMLNLQFSGFGSAVNAAEAGVGYALITHYDTKVQFDILGGYDTTKSASSDSDIHGAFVVEPRLSLKKKMTPNTYAETAISFPVYSVGRLNTQPSIFGGVGATF